MPNANQYLVPFRKGDDPRRKGNGRKNTKFLTELLIRKLKTTKKKIVVEGIDIETNLPVMVRLETPTKDAIIYALLKQAAKGNVVAIKEVLDRTEGRTMQPIQLKNDEDESFKITLNINPPNSE